LMEMGTWMFWNTADGRLESLRGNTTDTIKGPC
jgi:hypothetical protein